MKVIYLDMDGVLADFHAEAVRVHGNPPPPGSHDYHGHLGLPWSVFMDAIEHPGFWTGLKRLPHARLLVDWLGVWCNANGYELIALSTPGFSPTCAKEKATWLDSLCAVSWPEKIPLICTDRKELLAHPQRVLIDDNYDNIRAWRIAGGHSACLFPAVTNSMHQIASDPLPVVKRWFSCIFPKSHYLTT